MDIGKPMISSLVFERQSLVIDTQQVLDRGVEIMNVNRVFDHVVRIIIRCAIRLARFDSRACQPHRKTPRMMISSVVVTGQFPLAINGASKFAGTDNQCIRKQSRAFQIANGFPSLGETRLRESAPK